MQRECETGEYVCCLDEKSRKRARDELNETSDKDRDVAVQTFRIWVKQQKWLNAPTDYTFLLRFLRVRKFSQLAARESLIKYLSNKTNAAHWFADMDPSSPDVQEVIRTGFHIVLPRADKEGRRLLLSCFGKLDSAILKKYHPDVVYRAMMLIYEWLYRDEKIQVNGFIYIADQHGVSLDHFRSVLAPDNARKLIPVMLDTLPFRMKMGIAYREAPFFDILFPILKHFMKEKIRQRIHLIGWNLSKLYEKVDMSLLPEDYLPDDYDGPNAGKTSDIIEQMLADMNKPDFKEYIKDISSERYWIDVSKKPSEDQVPSVSFRKLNVD